MATKIKLGQRPEVFKTFPVKFIMPDGSSGAISTTFKYRTKKEFAGLLNKLFEGADEKRADGEPIDFVALMQKNQENAATQLLDAIKSWDLEYDLTKETLMQLADEVPAASGALMAAYSSACNEGKLGN